MSMPATHQVPVLRPALRRAPVPACEPPYDDERRPGAVIAVDGTLALAFPQPEPARSAPPVRALHVVPSAPPREPAAVQDLLLEADPTPTPLPARPRATILVRALLEVLSGVRPATQLEGWTTPGLQLQLQQRGLRAVQRRSRPGGCGPMPVLMSLHVSEPTPGVAEVCAVVRRGPRAGALALRMQDVAGRWQVTALQVG